MYIDRLGEQQVLKRRRPSPIKKMKRQPSFQETSFSQDVWPRNTQRETASGSGKFKFDFDFGKLKRSILDGLPRGRGQEAAPGNMERPAKRKSAAKVATTSGTVTDNAVTGGAILDEYLHRLANLKVPTIWIQRAAIILGVLAVAIIGLNWDRISGVAAQPNISPASLEDPFSPLSQRGAGFSHMQPPAWNSPSFAAGYYGLVYTDIPLDLTETFEWTTHIVAPGETISGIAVQHSVSMESIIALNDIRESWNLQTGRALRIPNMNGIPYTVMENDTFEGIAQSMGIPLNVLLDANDINDNTIVPGQILFIPGGRMDVAAFRRAIWRQPERLTRPVPGRITSGFGWREDPFAPGSRRMQLHRAVDLAGRTGDPVRAAKGGTVIHRGANPTYGNFIIIRHGEDYQTLYAHLSAFSVRAGETVRQGQEIGRIGSTGRATGPHLHFALFYRGEPINPIDRWR